MQMQMAADDRTLPKTDRVYFTLRQRIRDLELPPGTLLKKEEIAAELGVSRAPVSEAIARLMEQGLVDILPQHGSFVAEISAGAVREGMFIRMGLETEVMRQVAETYTPELMAALDQNIEQQREALSDRDLGRFYELDEALHDRIFEFALRPRARKFLDAARAQLDRVRRLALPVERRPEETLAEHERFVEAIRTGDPAFAAASMRAHLIAVSKSIEQQLALYRTRIL